MPYRYAIVKRNKFLTDNAEIILAYVRNTYGNAFKMPAYVRRKNKRIIGFES